MNSGRAFFTLASNSAPMPGLTLIRAISRTILISFCNAFGGASDDGTPAIHHYLGSGHVGSLIGGQPKHRMGDLLRVGPASHQTELDRLGFQSRLRGLEPAQMERRHDIAGTYRVDPDAMSRLLEGEGAGKRQQCSLGAVIL